MKKLRMSLEDLAVDTFETSAGTQAGRGTVQGHYGGTETLEPTAPYPRGNCGQATDGLLYGGNCGTGMTACWGGCGGQQTVSGTIGLFTNNDETCYYTAGPWESCVDCGPTLVCEG